ncbi:MAG: antitoxin Xre/MbcA/ParS toxin-binding domain-containing protein [Verrucomicrobiota bacterium]
MASTLTKSSQGGLDMGELAELREDLVEEKRRIERLLTRVEQVLSGAGQKDDSRRAAKATDQHAPPRPSPLDKVKGVLAATADLRMANGNLAADRVAKLYGVSLSQLAGWLGRTKQAVNKTPDADSLQNALSYFEHVARLRLVMKEDAEFRKWLRTPHKLLDNESPLQVLAKGEWQAIADYVDDILTGTPG